MEKNKLIIIGGALVIFLAFVAMLFLKREPAKPPQPSPTPRSTGFVIPTLQPTIKPTGQPTLPPTPTSTPTPSPSPTPPPAGNPKIKITDVSVNNFYNFGVEVKENGDVLIYESPNYKIEYFKASDKFLISILGRDFDALQKEAEAVFLQKLGITQQEACMLTALVGTAEADESQYGMTYPLSFCIETP